MAVSVIIWSAQGNLDIVGQKEKLKSIMHVLQAKEMFFYQDSVSKSIFLYSETGYPDKNELLQAFNSYLKIKPDKNVSVDILHEQQAVTYFLRLANGLAGENRLGQVQAFSESFNQSKKATLIGPVLQRLFQRSIWLHEKIRLNTDYFKYAIEPEKIFSELAEKIYGSVALLKVQVSGYHPSLIPFILKLYQLGCRKFIFNGNEVDLKLINEAVNISGLLAQGTNRLSADTDILIACANGPEIFKDQLSEKMSLKGNTPFLILNMAADNTIQLLAQKTYNVYCYNLADLHNIIQKNRETQNIVLNEVKPWIKREVDDFFNWLAANDLYKFSNIIGQSSQMQELYELISRISQTDISVLIQGQSGTGKELVSRAIHNMSSRTDKPFVVVNCGAIPENLLESELFGHIRGSFTGAVQDKRGLFFEADKGTILLDEIGEMPQQLQVKLLRFLQEGDLKPVGSNQTITVDVRVLAATNKNLAEMVDKGTFRSDLFYRLNVILLEIPNLMQRREDIPLLADFFLKKYAQKLHKEVREISPAAMDKLKSYPWPGNVRELENAIEHAVALSLGKQIIPDDFPESVKQIKKQGQQLSATAANHKDYTLLKDIEKVHIARVLNDASWDYEKACQLLGIGRTTLWRKIKEYDIRQK